MPEFIASSTRQIWRLTFDSSYDRPFFGDHEIIVYPLDQTGSHPFLHQVDFDQLETVRNAYLTANCARAVNARVVTWLERVETTDPADVDLEWLRDPAGHALNQGGRDDAR